MRFRWAKCWRASEFLRRLRAEFPHSGVFVSTSTLAGRAIAGEKLRGPGRWRVLRPGGLRFRRAAGAARAAAFGGGDRGDRDLAQPVPRGQAHRRRRWPSSTAAFPTALFRATCRFRWFFRAVLPAVDSILAQSEAMRAPVSGAGSAAGARARRRQLEVRFRGPPAPRRIRRCWRCSARLDPAEVWIAASTMPPAEPGDVDEDDAVMAAFAELAAPASRPAADSGAAQARTVRRGGRASWRRPGVPLAAAHRALGPAERRCRLPGVLLLDTIGELSGLFAAGRRGVHGRHAGAARRAQHSGAGALRQTRGRGSAHGEFPGHRGRVPRGRAPAWKSPAPAELAGRGGAPAGAAATRPREMGRRALACAEARRGAGARALAPKCANCCTPACRATARPCLGSRWPGRCRACGNGAAGGSRARDLARQRSWTCR